MEYSVQHASAYFVVTASGKASIDGFTKLSDALHTHPDWVPGTAVLFNLLKLDFSDLDRYGIDDLVELGIKDKQRRGAPRIAILVGDDLAYGLTNMWISLSSELQGEARIFRLPSEALDWLSNPTDNSQTAS